MNMGSGVIGGANVDWHNHNGFSPAKAVGDLVILCIPIPRKMT